MREKNGSTYKKKDGQVGQFCVNILLLDNFQYVSFLKSDQYKILVRMVYKILHF